MWQWHSCKFEKRGQNGAASLMCCLAPIGWQMAVNSFQTMPSEILDQTHTVHRVPHKNLTNFPETAKNKT